MGYTPAIMLSRTASISRIINTVSLPRAFSSVTDVKSFVTQHLEQNGFPADMAAKEYEQVQAAGIISMEVMMQLTESDWQGTGLSVGSSRVLQNAVKSLDPVTAPASPSPFRRALSRESMRL